MLALVYCAVVMWICATGCFICCALRPGIAQAVITMLVFSAAVLVVAEIDTAEQDYAKRHALDADKGGRKHGRM